MNVIYRTPLLQDNSDNFSMKLLLSKKHLLKKIRDRGKTMPLSLKVFYMPFCSLDYFNTT